MGQALYLDTSVVLAHLLAEDRNPSSALWQQELYSSRLLEYELWNRIHAYGLSESHAESVRDALGHINLIELSPLVLERALQPFPSPVRTLDALHLSTLNYLKGLLPDVQLASYDSKICDLAKRWGIAHFEI